ncbi:MAG: Na+/H+ antiporter NhaA [bacterium]
MHAENPSAFKKAFSQLSELAAFLLTGTFLALIWANVDHAGYEAFIEHPLFFSSFLSHEPDHAVSFHFLVNDIFMVLFFGIAMKEVSESFLPGGALSSVRKAAMPAIATAGGVLGPIAVFFILRMVLNPQPDIVGGWAIPTATDIAYCWLFARFIFGPGHPAVTFLLVLAVLDDLIGMLIIATFYTSEVHPMWMGLVVAAIVFCEVLRRMGVKSFWPYLLIAMPLSWVGLHYTGVHAALALVPIIPFMPHAERDAGIFAEDDHQDTMNQFEHFFKPIVDVGLFTFGLANAGVLLSGEALTASPTWIIFLALLIGKTIGIFLFCVLGKSFGLTLPEGMNIKQTLAMGCVAGIGFTVALFVTTVAIQKGVVPVEVAGELKLGALMSFFSGFAAFFVAKLVGIKKVAAA